MRERLTVSFIAITVLLLLGAGLLRSYVSDDEVRSAEADDASAMAAALSVVVSDVVRSGGAIDEGLLRPFLTSRLELRYAESGVDDLVLAGDDFGGGDADHVVSSAAVAGGGTLTVSRQHNEALEGIWGTDTRQLIALFGLLAFIAGVVGYFVARNLSGPFRQLAVAAAALGRGRFDLELPRGGVPEARAIASALELSASQLRERIEREREFGQHASHVLRTPLTSLRFRLEELVDEPGLSADARDATQACLKAVAQLDDVTGELVELGGRGVLVAGAAIPLRDLATQVAQRWADALHDVDRLLTAAVEGDIELIFTPGPVEQLLDLLLGDIVAHETGSVRLVFEGAASRLRIDVMCGRPDGAYAAPTHPVHERVHTILDALGGKLEESGDAPALRLYLPRR